MTARRLLPWVLCLSACAAPDPRIVVSIAPVPADGAYLKLYQLIGTSKTRQGTADLSIADKVLTRRQLSFLIDPPAQEDLGAGPVRLLVQVRSKLGCIVAQGEETLPPATGNAISVALEDVPDCPNRGGEVPIVTRAQPARVPARSGAEVVLTGHGFLPGMDVWIDGQRASAMPWVSLQELRVQVPRAADPQRALGRPIALGVGSDGKAAPRKDLLAYFDEAIGFPSSPKLYETALGPTLAVKDVNNDGRVDVVVGSPNQIMMLHINGGSSEDPYGERDRTVQLAVTEGKEGGGNVTLEDMTGDGLPDLLLQDTTMNREGFLTIRPNSGDPERPFAVQGATNFPQIKVGSPPGPEIRGFAVAKLDQDELPDLILGLEDSSKMGDGRYTLRRLLNAQANPGYAFASGAVHSECPMPLGDNYTFALSMHLSDLNRDGELDVITNGTRFYPILSSLSYLGRCTAPVAGPMFDLSTFYYSAVGDVDGDGLPDLAVSDRVVHILTNDGKGGFAKIRQTVRNFGSDYVNARHVALKDLNGDGLADLVVMVQDGSSVGKMRLAVLLASPQGLFSENVVDPSRKHADLPVGGSGRIAVEDVNQDGRPDVLAVCDRRLVATTSNLVVWLN